MMAHAAHFVDHKISNNWARVGQKLTELGTLFSESISQFSSAEQAVVLHGLQCYNGTKPLPEIFIAQVEMPVRKRRARMSKAMTPEKIARASEIVKTARKVKLAKVVDPTIPKRPRGRPRKHPLPV